MSESKPYTYRGWQAEKSGVIGSLSLTGCVFVTLAALTVMLPMYVSAWSKELVAIPIALCFVGMAYGRISGLAAEEWLMLFVRHQINTAMRRNVFLSGVFAPRRSSDDRQPMDLPGVLARLRILSVSLGPERELGVVYDPAENTYSAILEVRYPGLALVDTDRMNQRVTAWGAFLKSLCVEGGAISRVAVHERSLPDDGTALKSWVSGHLHEDAPEPAKDVVKTLTAGGGPMANMRSTYLTVTMSATRARMAIKGAGGGQLGASAVLVRELTALQSAVSSADLQVTNQLNPRQVAETIRVAFDPDSVSAVAYRNVSATQESWEGTAPGVAPEVAGPAAAETNWGSYKHDGATTVTYQVRSWPSSSIYATCLQPLLRPRPHARRAMSLIYEPLGPRRARNELTKDRTKRDVARRLRRRTGRIESMDERADAARAIEQDTARASGHGVVRFTALISVTVTDPNHLEGACAELQQDGSTAGLEIRRVWGAQDAAFAASALPLGQGLPIRRVGI